MSGVLDVSNVAQSSVHARAPSWCVPEKTLSLVMLARASLIAPRKRAMPRVTRPTQITDLGMQPTDLSERAGDKRPL